jgi:hypothetical protein
LTILSNNKNIHFHFIQQPSGGIQQKTQQAMPQTTKVISSPTTIRFSEYDEVCHFLAHSPPRIISEKDVPEYLEEMLENTDMNKLEHWTANFAPRLNFHQAGEDDSAALMALDSTIVNQFFRYTNEHVNQDVAVFHQVNALTPWNTNSTTNHEFFPVKIGHNLRWALVVYDYPANICRVFQKMMTTTTATAANLFQLPPNFIPPSVEILHKPWPVEHVPSTDEAVFVCALATTLARPYHSIFWANDLLLWRKTIAAVCFSRLSKTHTLKQRV